MKTEIVLVRPIFAPTMAAMETEFVVHKEWLADDVAQFRTGPARNARGLVTTGLVGFDRALLDAFPQIEIVCTFGATLEALDLDAARRRGIVVTNTPLDISESVADLALGLLLAVTRRLCAGDRFIREGRWPYQEPPLGIGLRGRTCGILGLGKVGKAVARRVDVLGMRIAYHDVMVQPDIPYAFVDGPEALASASDILVVTVRATPNGPCLVDRGVLDALGPAGILINVARGAVIDESAMVGALIAGRLGGAGLDVFVDEPQVPSGLLNLETVVLSPHRGSAVHEVREARGKMVLRSLREHFAGQRVTHAVAP